MIIKVSKKDHDAELAKVLRDIDDLHDSTVNRMKSLKDDLGNKMNELNEKNCENIETLKDDLDQMQVGLNEKMEKDKEELESRLRNEMDNLSENTKVIFSSQRFRDQIQKFPIFCLFRI